MKVLIKKRNENFKIPEKQKKGDFCYDVYAVDEKEIAPNIWAYSLGFAYEFDRTNNYGIVFNNNKGESNAQYCNISIDFRPRSSVWKTGMVLSNSNGTLDEFFRGEAKAIYYHLFPNMPRYKVGERIGQIKLGFTIPIEFEVVDEINMDTERGEGGFGSTGTK